MSEHVQEPREREVIEAGPARELSLARVRKLWVEGNDDLARLAQAEPEAEPVVIHDLAGPPLFYDFELADEEGAAGVVRAASSPAIGTPFVSAQLGPRRWNPDEAIRDAEKAVAEEHKGAKITGSRLVCYCYPKIGVEVGFDLPRQGSGRTIVDVSDGLPVVNLGADELEGSTAYSYYETVVEPTEAKRRRRWARLEDDWEVLRRIAPPILDVGSRLRPEMRVELYDTLVKEFPYVLFPISSQKVIRFGPRCTPHECFQLYAQQTNVYCAVATGQMILDFYRRYFTQDQIAAAMGTGPGGTDNTGQVAGYESLSGNCLDATYDTSAAWSEAKAEIDANRPLKSGIPGHARAAAGWMKTWSWTAWAYDLSLKIYDPWPWNADICAGGAVVWEDWDAVTHTNFIYVRHS
jgi:Peptidase_C39 like family